MGGGQRGWKRKERFTRKRERGWRELRGYKKEDMIEPNRTHSE